MQSGLLGILNEILFIPSEANLGIIPRTVNIAISLNIPSEPDRMADKSGCQNTNIGHWGSLRFSAQMNWLLNYKQLYVLEFEDR